jgi:dTDP-4-amino-4,6-dideoxygalactose transaminase
MGASDTVEDTGRMANRTGFLAASVGVGDARADHAGVGEPRGRLGRLAHWLLREEEPRPPHVDRIPFNRPRLEGDELEHVRDAIALGQLSGDGAYTRRCQEWLRREIGAARVLLTPSGTAALEMCALLLRLAPGDEVIVPSFTFPTTAGAFALFGARPVFVDVRGDTLNLDEARVEERIGERTRAIVAVHYAGIGCAMDRLTEIAERHGLVLLEDNAHGLFGRWRGRPLGSIGALSVASFHDTKNVTCGEGGALAVNDRAFLERAEVLREKGTDRARFLRGEVRRYRWIDLGSSYVLSDISAAFLLGQLEAAAAIQTRRRAIWQRYAEELADWATRTGAALPVVPPDCEPAYHIFHLLMPDGAARERLLHHLDRSGVQATSHYAPLHASPFAVTFGPPAPCPVADSVAERIVRLPLFTGLSATAQGRVIGAIRAF